MNNKFIDLNSNDELSKFRGNDLQELLKQVKKFYLEYRDSLGLPKEVTFGTELEYETLFSFIPDAYVKVLFKDWVSRGDGSLDYGGEIISPIMTDDKKYWKELKHICKVLNAVRVDTSHNAGGHVHIGAHVLGDDPDAWREFLKLYAAYESILFRFAYGDKINGRKGVTSYASPYADKLHSRIEEISELKRIKDLIFCIPVDGRYSALNFSNLNFKNPEKYIARNTIEFRAPNASSNAVIWQNNINAFAKMLVSASQKVMDEDFLDYKLKNEYSSFLSNRYLYNCIELKEVLEFVDLVFDNNLDKMYFLRQYLKDFKEDSCNNMIVKSKKFVK